MGGKGSGNFTGPRGHRPKRPEGYRRLNLGYIPAETHASVKYYSSLARMSMSAWVCEAIYEKLAREIEAIYEKPEREIEAIYEKLERKI